MQCSCRQRISAGVANAAILSIATNEVSSSSIVYYLIASFLTLSSSGCENHGDRDQHRFAATDVRELSKFARSDQFVRLRNVRDVRLRCVPAVRAAVSSQARLEGESGAVAIMGRSDAQMGIHGHNGGSRGENGNGKQPLCSSCLFYTSLPLQEALSKQDTTREFPIAMAEYLRQMRKNVFECKRQLEMIRERRQVLVRGWDETNRAIEADFNRAYQDILGAHRMIQRIRNAPTKYTNSEVLSEEMFVSNSSNAGQRSANNDNDTEHSYE